MGLELYMMYVERVGVPLSILVVFAIAVWRVLKWLGDKVVSPITASHIALVNETRECNRTNSETLKQMTILLESYTAGMTQVVAQGVETSKASAAVTLAAMAASNAATHATELAIKIHAQAENILTAILKVDEKLTGLAEQKASVKTTTTTTVQEPLTETKGS